MLSQVKASTISDFSRQTQVVTLSQPADRRAQLKQEYLDIVRLYAGILKHQALIVGAHFHPFAYLWILTYSLISVTTILRLLRITTMFFPLTIWLIFFRKDPDHQRILDPDWRIRNHLPSQTILKITTLDRALLYLVHHLSVICVFILPPSEINLI